MRLLLLALGLFPLAVGAPAPTSSAPTSAVPALTAPRSDDDAPAATAAEAPAAFSDERAAFAVRVRSLTIPYRVMALFVMPNDSLRLHATAPGAPAGAVRTISTAARFSMTARRGLVRPTGPRTWQWTAPSAPGLYPLTVTDATSGDAIRLNVFVLTPYDHRQRRLDGYRIGHYRRKPLRDNPVYERPPGFVRLTAANRDVRVAPHFTLGQFACKQTDAYPQYLLLREQLLLKLEAILQSVNAHGHAVRTLHVMSGYRTPYYNRSIGNQTDYSRHLYGGAADIFVDADGDAHMDDLNDDGAVTRADARLLADLVEAAHDGAPQPITGGMGIYGPAPHRGPFVHVDARGYRARW